MITVSAHSPAPPPPPARPALDVALIHAYDFVPAPAEPGLAARTLCTEPMYLASTGPVAESPEPDGVSPLGQGVAVVPYLGATDLPTGVTLTRLPMHRRTRIACRAGNDHHPAVRAVATALRGVVPPELAYD